MLKLLDEISNLEPIPYKTRAGMRNSHFCDHLLWLVRENASILLFMKKDLKPAVSSVSMVL